MKSKYDISGMSCSACSAHVEKSVGALDGVKDVNVNLISGVMTVEFDEEKVTEADMKKAVESGGYGMQKAKTFAEKKEQKKIDDKKERRNLLFRFAVSLAFLIPIMYLSMGHMIGLHLPSFLSGDENALKLAILEFVLTLPVVAVNRIYYISGFKKLFSGGPNMDTLVAIGTLSPVIYGVFAIVMMILGGSGSAGKYVHELYFETSAMILTIVTLGKILEGRSKKNTLDALDKLTDLTPKTATLIDGDKEITVNVEDIKVGDVFLVRPGENVACDGEIVGGCTNIDESEITGESMPVEKGENDTVYAGSKNIDGAIRVKASFVGEETTVAKIIMLVENASGSKAPIARLADKVSAYFVPAVIAVSVISFAVWLLCGADFEFAFSRAISVLVISCPCALGLATPVAITVGTGKAAENGILVKSAQSLEVLGKIQNILFDKTGTLTNGIPAVTDVIPDETEENTLEQIAFSIEKQSEHPISKAICEKAVQNGVKPLEAVNFTAFSGFGVKAEIEGETCLAGNLKFMEQNGIDAGKSAEFAEKLAKEGKTPVFFAKGGKCLGIIAVADTEKSDSKKTVEKLAEAGIKSVMLTGDNEITAKNIAYKLGISEVKASLLPADKEKAVSEFALGGVTAMVGDGINDSAALARADVGITFASGTDIAVDSSDVIIMSGKTEDILKSISLSKAVIKNIKMSLFWALFYNVVGIPVASGVLYPFTGLTLNPMIGAAAMSMSSVCVVLNALRLKKWKYKETENEK